MPEKFIVTLPASVSGVFLSFSRSPWAPAVAPGFSRFVLNISLLKLLRHLNYPRKRLQILFEVTISCLANFSPSGSRTLNYHFTLVSFSFFFFFRPRFTREKMMGNKTFYWRWTNKFFCLCFCFFVCLFVCLFV